RIGMRARLAVWRCEGNGPVGPIPMLPTPPADRIQASCCEHAFSRRQITVEHGPVVADSEVVPFTIEGRSTQYLLLGAEQVVRLLSDIHVVTEMLLADDCVVVGCSELFVAELAQGLQEAE